MIATTAFGPGINNHSVDLVIMVGPPYGMVDYAQKAGRVGRGGERGTAIVIVDTKSLDRLRKECLALRQLDAACFSEDREAECRDYTALYHLLTSNTCMRMQLSAHFDGKTGSQCGSRAVQLCSVCEQQKALGVGNTSPSDDLMNISSVTHARTASAGEGSPARQTQNRSYFSMVGTFHA